ncbi:MAG: hypothetical protein ING73_16720 [Rhodocyclaceae bacterium]|nr:hypothetical protein [Rhodocyclaceae bacterium]MCA3024270.1 hypothetical protein [Rhodocyclaceae bacterium]MCA3032054.1 hypothetical protein [Rhodocyclaceae bacterium]MCA3037544.1 hypothetical protein [Rhodocyclaceae bacterium]MCA3044985.1 hypothetical protein [Rhodocyclaceae bacterium]
MTEQHKGGGATHAENTWDAFFGVMYPATKFRWVLKLAVCVMSFGFVFPNVMTD